MSIENKLMYGLDPSKYPTRLGQPWKNDEIVKLLTSIQKNKSVEEIAKDHDRTVGDIQSYLRKLAADYHFNDNRPMEEIQKFTGLTKEEIEDSIKKRKQKEDKVAEKAAEKSLDKKANTEAKKNKVVSTKKETTEERPTMSEVVSLLRDIQCKLDTLIEKVS